MATLRDSLPLSAAVLCLGITTALQAQNPYGQWKNGPPSGPDFFPIGVWLQSEALAERYQAIGINLYVGLWQGPTAKQLKILRPSGMPVFGAQTEAALEAEHRGQLRGWLHMDEPDNAQRKPGGGFGPPVTPAAVLARFRDMRKADPTRPIFLNLGQGVANDGWKGRGSRFGHMEDYPKYVKGGDIVSFDIYPVTHKDPKVQGRLELVATGVERMVRWSAGRKIVWNFIECTHIQSKTMPTPAEVHAEVWMSLIHGSQGIIYFAHEWQPKFAPAGLLQYPAMTKAVAATNAQIHALAPVLHEPTDARGATVKTSDASVPVQAMVKRKGGATYLFAVAMRKKATEATFRVKSLPKSATATVLGEDRTIPVVDGRFQDEFEGYGVHLYRIDPKGKGKK